MTIILYDLAGADGRRFSPHCWRTRLALEHKALAYRTEPTRFTEIAEVTDGEHTALPVIADGARLVGDSWRIAEYLEATYPDRPSLFDGSTGKTFAAFVQNWLVPAVHMHLVRMILKDIHDILTPEDQAYFRRTREERFGRSLEDVQGEREAARADLNMGLKTLELTLRDRVFLGGGAPSYVDYLVFSAFQWARCSSDCALLPEDSENIRGWLERMLDLYDGLARREPAFW